MPEEGEDRVPIGGHDIDDLCQPELPSEWRWGKAQQ